MTCFRPPPLAVIVKIADPDFLIQTNAIRLPSGEKVGESRPNPKGFVGNGVVSTFRTRPSFAAITEIVACLPYCRVLKAISDPSGDHDGRPFNPVGVRERSLLPSAFIV